MAILDTSIQLESQADILSRNPVEAELKHCDGTEEYINYLFSHALPVATTTEQLIQEYSNDEVMKALGDRVNGETNAGILEKTKMFNGVIDEMTVTEQGIVMRGYTIVIPESLCERLVDLAHEGHQGIRKTK